MRYLSIILVFLLCECGPNVQVFTTAAIGSKEVSGFYVYENDSIRVQYDFWASEGRMSFFIYNKSAKPLYVDWKNSSYIPGSEKLPYWRDETLSKSASASYFKGYWIADGSSMREERITFIPPKSFIKQPLNFRLRSSVFHFNKEDLKNKPHAVRFQKENSPLHFRNYLALSFFEDSKQQFFIDNEFYINGVEEMKQKQFLGKSHYEHENGIYKKVYEIHHTGTSFYLINRDSYP